MRRMITRSMSTALVALGALLAWGAGCEGEPVSSELPGECVDEPCTPPTPPAEAKPEFGKLVAPSQIEMCADVSVNFEKQIPSVVLLLDQSGSMTSNFCRTG